MAFAAKAESCTGCPLEFLGKGFVTVEGTGSNGVLIVREAPSEGDALAGKHFADRSGHALTQLLLRRGHRREHFAIASLIACQPPFMRLRGQWYAEAALHQCRPNLQAAMALIKPKVILALGDSAHRALVGETEGILKSRGYVEWSPTWRCWVIGTYDPYFIQKGNEHLSGVFLHDVEKAIQVAEKGHLPHLPTLHADPPFYVVEALVRKYEEACRKDPDNTLLAYDIETPYKADTEDEGALEVADPSYQILRIGFSWQEGEAFSITWSGVYMALIQRLFATASPKLVWNGRYDNPRILANGVTIRGEVWDLMWGWHVINSDLPKGLAFVATFLADGQGRWKHLSKAEPARYNAIDAEVTRRIGTRLKKDLEHHHLWRVFHRHVVRLDVILDGMSAAGLRVDDEARRAKSQELASQLEGLTAQMQEAVPLEGKRLRSYKGMPKGVTWGLGSPCPNGFTVQVVPTPTLFCPGCGEESPKKIHFRTFKRPNRKRPQNPCAGLEPVEKLVDTPRLARIERFVPSNKQMLAYATALGHKVVLAKAKPGEVQKPTFDDQALKELIKRYPSDTLYPLVRDYRDVEKLKGTYVGEWDEAAAKWISGPPVGTDGRIHPLFSHNPSTLRLASSNPNGQNLDSRVKDLYVPTEGWRFLEVDYSAIEAKIVGYEAMSPTIVRLAALGVHDFLCSHILARDGAIPAPADLSWSDEDLRVFFADLKRRFKPTREMAKRIVHLSNYGGTPRRIADTYPEEFPTVKAASALQGLYFEVCPDIPRWQQRVIDQAEDSGYLVNAFGYLHRFWSVKEWTKERDGSWSSSWGKDAKRCLAFGPQSTAAGIIKEAMLALEEAGVAQYLRLQVHDSLLLEAPPDVFDEVAAGVVSVMKAPIPQMPLPWAPGEHLAIGVEAKVGAVNGSWKSLQVDEALGKVPAAPMRALW